MQNLIEICFYTKVHSKVDRGGDNHLALAREWGLGTNLLDEIEIAGPKIQDVVYKFKPAL